jgi:hypothetical protein
MKWVGAAVVGLAAALWLPSAVAAAGTPCGGLTDGRWRATDIRATHLTCRSVRTKLRRWLPPPLPANSYGWNCFAFRGRRMCAVGQGDAPRFTFRLGRRPTATSAFSVRHTRLASCRPVLNLRALEGSRYAGTDAVRIRASGVGCRRARRVAHRATVKGFRLGATVLSYRWRSWWVERDLLGPVDRYWATRNVDTYNQRIAWRVRG